MNAGQVSYVAGGTPSSEPAVFHSGFQGIQEAAAHTLTLDFCDAPGATADLRPDRPLVVRW